MIALIHHWIVRSFDCLNTPFDCLNAPFDCVHVTVDTPFDCKKKCINTPFDYLNTPFDCVRAYDLEVDRLRALCLSSTYPLLILCLSSAYSSRRTGCDMHHDWDMSCDAGRDTSIDMDRQTILKAHMLVATTIRKSAGMATRQPLGRVLNSVLPDATTCIAPDA